MLVIFALFCLTSPLTTLSKTKSHYWCEIRVLQMESGRLGPFPFNSVLGQLVRVNLACVAKGDVLPIPYMSEYLPFLCAVSNAYV